MGIDIQYLLFLQDIRVATGGVFNEFFNGISKFAVEVMIFLPYVIFWAVNKKWGYRYIATLCLGDLINGVLKLMVCAYRPWIRSSQVEPAGDSKVAATGYSFPSGHTMVATTMYGTTLVWQWKKRRWLAILCGVLVLLTGFSRNFLGVHTPQDVLVGMCESILLILITGFVMKHLDGKKKTADILTAAGIAAVILILVYITLKPYPMDYVDGVLLVDPQVMMVDTFRACGAFLGFLIGSFIERHFIHYEIPEQKGHLALLTFVGLAIMFGWRSYFAGATVVAAFGSHWGNLIAMAIMTLFAMTIWPLCIRKFSRDPSTAGYNRNHTQGA